MVSTDGPLATSTGNGVGFILTSRETEAPSLFVYETNEWKAKRQAAQCLRPSCWPVWNNGPFAVPNGDSFASYDPPPPPPAGSFWLHQLVFMSRQNQSVPSAKRIRVRHWARIMGSCGEIKTRRGTKRCKATICGELALGSFF